MYATLQVTGPRGWNTADMLNNGFSWRYGHWAKQIPTLADAQANQALASRLAAEGRAVSWIFVTR